MDFWECLKPFNKNSPQNSWSLHFMITRWNQNSWNVGTSCITVLWQYGQTMVRQYVVWEERLKGQKFRKVKWNLRGREIILLPQKEYVPIWGICSASVITYLYAVHVVLLALYIFIDNSLICNMYMQFLFLNLLLSWSTL